jgi:hypothetical protein
MVMVVDKMAKAAEGEPGQPRLRTRTRTIVAQATNVYVCAERKAGQPDFQEGGAGHGPAAVTDRFVLHRPGER